MKQRAAMSPMVTGMGLVTVGMMVANTANYLLHVPASRWLGPAGYSEFASLLSVQLLLAVPQTALQAVVAREAVRGASTHRMRALSVRCAVLVGISALIGVPVIAYVLHVSIGASAAGLIAAPFLVLLGGEQGLLQGGRRFRELAFLYGVTGVARVAPAAAVLGFGGSPAWSLGAASVATAVVAMVARWLSRDARPPRPHGERAEPGVFAVLEASQVQLAMLALASVDLLVARAVLPEDQAGLYALGAVVTKIAFWLPAPVSIVLYPQMSHPEHSVRAVRTMLSVLAGIGIFDVIAAFVASPLVPLVVGDAYAPIDSTLWAFALNGACLAVLQGALYASIAAEHTWLAGIAWVALIVEFVLLVTVAGTVGQFIAVAATSAGVAAIVASALTLRLTSKP